MLGNSKKFKKYRKIIKNSGLFDAKYYLRKNHDARVASETPLDHFVKVGLKEDRKPNKDFDPKWYREYYEDVKADGAYPFIHYVIYGQSEGRSINEKTELKKNNLVMELPTDNTAKEAEEILEMPSSQVEHPHTLDDYEKHLYHELAQLNLDLGSYFDINRHSTEYNDPLVDYIKHWSTHMPTIPHIFNTQLYLELYPDIRSNNVNPLWHFMYHGKEEGRIGYIDTQKHMKVGKLPLNPSKENIIFVSHESSATGAPLLGYNIVEELKEFNIIHIVIKSANIHAMFFENCHLIIENIEQDPYTLSKYIVKDLLRRYDIKCAFYNSIVTAPVLEALKDFGIPSVFLIHEFADYSRPIGRMSQTIFYADQVVVPATIIKKSIMEELSDMYLLTTSPVNISILPQGKLPILADSYGDSDTPKDLLKKFKIDTAKDTKIIVASGYVQIRKGTDLFVQLAKKIKQTYEGKVKFVWVGEGYDPLNDMAYSAWLKRELDYANLGDDFIFLEHQKTLDSIFEIADLFCLTSRMDPFPNVVIDALTHDLPIACFDNATGSSEFLENSHASYIMSDYLDVETLSQKIVSFLKEKKHRKGINKKIAKKYLNFQKYMDSLKKIMQQAIDIHTDNVRVSELLIKENIFDYDFYGNNDNENKAALEYVEMSKKGLNRFNPMPGFSQNLWLQKHSKEKNVVPLYEAFLEKNILTHDCVTVPYDIDNKEINFTYAVHLHLFYPELSEEFKTYFSHLPGTFDLYITIIDKKDKKSVLKVFEDSGARHIDVSVVPNIGRDSGPLLFGIKDKLLNKEYKVIGHFHSKKSMSTDNTMGDKWRTFLMEQLIGDKNTAMSILHLFNDDKVGLVFPEDRHCVTIGQNIEYVNRLCEMLHLPHVDETPIFPIGNMFWAKIDAIQDLFMLPENILQEEPLPYDGSFMHAIERITPMLIEHKNYIYKTVYKKGITW